MASMCREDLERDQERQSPYLAHEPDEEPLIDPLREPGPKEKLDYEEDVRRDREQIGLEGSKTKRSDLEGEICRDWVVGEQPAETDEVYWPKVPVSQALPEHAPG